MVNERNTEAIVRNHLHKDDFYIAEKIIYDEQTSKNLKISKLLANASKSGGGGGKPDFIIQYTGNSDLIIVVECKAETTKHESNDRNLYTEFAVDGVLLYASFLSKEYDVLAIAVSGEDIANIRISHFLQLKNTQEAHPVFQDDNFLSLKEYLEGYKKDERKFNQDLQELLKYAKTLNAKLHTLKVRESERSLLISGTLIALKADSFRKGYKHRNPKSLAEDLVNTIGQKLSETQTKYTKDIISSYSFIKTHTILAEKEGKLKTIIDEIDDKVNNFVQTYQYFDTLGQFYIEFLRYANNDKGLGIVLTPPHITELFCEIAEVDKDSVVLDTCTGTGGFLISAMQKMVVDAGSDTKKEKCIKEKQIVGVELQHDIYSLLCSNMYIHGDGRSNLIKGSCFDEEIKSQVAEFEPTVGFLNPPYKTNTEDKEELEFVLNSLEQLKTGSYCVAIVPMSCVLATKGKGADLKKQILKKHRLIAVFSMPNELFKNSDVGTVTCVLVIKAKKRPPVDGYKTYFAYWKQDGFYNRKISGRADYDNRWQSIRTNWLKKYRAKDEEAGHSIKQQVSFDDDWCAEAYMETDYSLLEDSCFNETVKNYLLFCFKYQIIKEISVEPFFKLNDSYELDVENWKALELTDLFKVTGSKSFTKNEIQKYDEGKYPYVVTSSENNGVQGFYDKYTEEKNVLTIDSATIGSCFYQPLNFSASDHVEKLIPNFNLNVYIGLFLQTVINLEKFRYGYGRKFAQKRIKETKIKLPATNKMGGGGD